MTTELTTANGRVASDLYRSLATSSGSHYVRLLRIEPPSAQENGGPIRGDLYVADLKERPAFFALSYVWGKTATEPHAVLCGEYALPVSTKCHSALMHLRRKLGALSIWIDAACINQDDAKEKSQQIPLMREIYSSAQRVYIWLGDGNAATDRAMTYLATTGLLECFYVKGNPNSSALCKPRVWAAAWSLFTAGWNFRRHVLPFRHNDLGWSWRLALFQRIRGPSGAIYASYQDLDELLSRAWIRRIWTYQEIMLAHNPVVVCGDAQISWFRFAFSIVFLDLVQLDRPRDILITWKEVVLSRDRRSALADSVYGDAQSVRPSKLQDYQQSIYLVAQKYTNLKRLDLILHVGLMMAIFALWLLYWLIVAGIFTLTYI